MAITYIDSGTASVQAGTDIDLVPTYPATVAGGDIAILRIMHRQNTAGITYSISDSGRTWSLIHTNNQAGGAPQTYLYWRRCTGVEDGETVTLTASDPSFTSSKQFANIDRFDGFPHVVQESIATALTTGTTVSDVGVTTQIDSCLAVNYVFTNATNASFGAFSGTSGGTWSQVVWNNGAPPAMGLYTATLASAGTIDGGTITVSTQNVRIVGFALAPAQNPMRKRYGGTPFTTYSKGVW